MTRRFGRSVMGSVLVAAALVTFLPAQAAFAFDDVPSGYWDKTAITFVAETPHTWMQDYGTKTFQPKINELRKYLARTLVKIWAPTEQPDTEDQDQGCSADRSVLALHQRRGEALLDAAVQERQLRARWRHQGAGLRSGGRPGAEARRVRGRHAEHPHGQRDEVRRPRICSVPRAWPRCCSPTQPLRRDDGHRADPADHPRRGGVFDLVGDQPDVVAADPCPAVVHEHRLPTLDLNGPVQAAQQKVTSYALSQIGYPYIYAGEWNAQSPNGYCCGYQPKGGFDCSGFAWWVMKMVRERLQRRPVPKLPRWSLPAAFVVRHGAQHGPAHHVRRSAPRRSDVLRLERRQDWQDVDHVGIFLGNGWMIHSTGSNDGALLDRTDSVQGHYYYDTFVFGRRLIGGSKGPRAGPWEAVRDDGRRPAGG